MKEYGWGDTVKFEEEAETTKGSESVQIQVDVKELYAKLCLTDQKERKNMKLEDMKVGAFVKCTKPEWDCYGDIFEITKMFPFSHDEWEITRRPYMQKRESGKTIKALNTVSTISRQTLQHNFKLYKQHTVRRKLKIVCFADNTTFAGDGIVGETVGLYHEDKYDEFVGAVEALTKLYGRKSPFDEIEELKEAARAAEEPVVSDK